MQQLKRLAVQDGMPTGLHFKLYYDIEVQHKNTFAAVEDIQNQEDNTLIGVTNKEENILRIYKDTPDINEIQETLYMPSEFYIPNFNDQNKALND